MKMKLTDEQRINLLSMRLRVLEDKITKLERSVAKEIDRSSQNWD